MDAFLITAPYYFRLVFLLVLLIAIYIVSIKCELKNLKFFTPPIKYSLYLIVTLILINTFVKLNTDYYFELWRFEYKIGDETWMAPDEPFWATNLDYFIFGIIGIAVIFIGFAIFSKKKS